MKLAFPDDISAGGKYPWADPNRLIRLYQFDKTEAAALRQLISENLIEQGRSIDLTALPFIEPVNCRLIRTVSAQDEGIFTTGNLHFT